MNLADIVHHYFMSLPHVTEKDVVRKRGRDLLTV